MTRNNEELRLKRDATYRVPHSEVCKACKYWHQLRRNGYGLCHVGAERDGSPARLTDSDGTCDLWEGQKSDQ